MLHHALNVHTVTNLKQAILDRIPVGEQVLVRRNAEVERIQVGQIGRIPLRWQVDAYRRNSVLGGHHLIREIVELAFEVRVCLHHRLDARRHKLRTRPQQRSCQHVELRRLVDRLHRVLFEELIAPFDQIIDVLQHNRPLVRHRAQLRDNVGVKRVLTPYRDLVLSHGIVAVDRLHQGRDLLINVVLRVHIKERSRNPEALRHGIAGRARRIKDVLVPSFRIGKALIPGQR